MEKKAQNVVVYLRADDVRMLEAKVLHTDPKTWVRGLVRHALDRMREKEEADAPTRPSYGDDVKGDASE